MGQFERVAHLLLRNYSKSHSDLDLLFKMVESIEMKKLIFIFAISLVYSISHADDFFTSKLAIYALMQNLKLSPSTTAQVEMQGITSDQGMDLVRLRLSSDEIPGAQIVMRGPTGFLQRSDYSYQVLFVTSGFLTGASSVMLLGEIPNTVVIGYEYPFTGEAMVSDPGKLLQTFRLTAGQIALSLKWVTEQSWANPNRTIAMGVSLGGIFLPMSLHIAQEMNVSVSHVIFGYTGSDIESILVNNLKGQVPEDFLNALISATPVVNVINDPKLHLPYLKGRFFVIQSEQDQVIPRVSTEQLYSLLPNPKVKIMLQGPHIDTTQGDLILQTKEAILKWLN